MTDTHIEPETCVSRAAVDQMLKDWQQECAAHPALYNQANVLRDRLKAIPAGISRAMFDAEVNAMLVDDLVAGLSKTS